MIITYVYNAIHRATYNNGKIYFFELDFIPNLGSVVTIDNNIIYIAIASDDKPDYIYIYSFNNINNGYNLIKTLKIGLTIFP